MENLKRYILQNWHKTVRETPPGSLPQSARLIPLPRPYTVPSIDTHFQEMYYWDTYFTNRGLMLSGMTDQAVDNLENFIYLINTYGYIPNGNNKSLLNRSQPPFFGKMLSDVYAKTGDKPLLLRGAQALEREYAFWQTRRRAANGLNYYDTDADEARLLRAVDMYQARTGISHSGDLLYWGKNILAEAESGWDFCARFEGKCREYNAVDLNALLYFDERFLAFAEQELELGNGEEWRKRAETRLALMRQYMLGEDGVYYDYSYVEEKRSPLKSAASFFSPFVGILPPEQGIDPLLSALELPFGLQAAEPSPMGSFQWGDQNAWACLQLVAVEGLLQCGRAEDALRIATKFVGAVEQTFLQSGKLFEKYNAEKGNADAVSEYGTPEMMGWTAGVYLALCKKLEK